MQKIQEHLKAKNFEEVEKTADSILKLMGVSAPKETLKDDQGKRLRQLELQQEGPFALLHGEGGKDLKILARPSPNPTRIDCSQAPFTGLSAKR